MKKFTLALIATLAAATMPAAAATVTHHAAPPAGYLRNVVAEEVTGTWCGYCPLGIAHMKKMSESHPDNFFGIAVHADVSASWPDPMGVGVETYLNTLFDRFPISGYPKCVSNRTRKYVNSPAMLSYYYNMIMEDGELTYVGVKAGSSYDEASGKVTVTTDVMFAEDVASPYYRLAYVVVENRVHATAAETHGSFSGYEQNNYYAGGGMGDCGGFENLPSVISADQMYYDDVARGIFPSFDGEEPFTDGSKILRGDVFSTEFTFELPSTVRVADNCKVIVMLLDKDGRVCNAARVDLNSGGSGIATPSRDDADEAFYTLTGIRVDNPGPGLYIRGGRKVCITR